MLKIVFLKRKKRDSLFRDSSVPIATESTVKCYMEIEIGPAENVVKRGRIELTVFDSVCPKTSENFRRLCCNNCRLGGLLAWVKLEYVVCPNKDQIRERIKVKIKTLTDMPLERASSSVSRRVFVPKSAWSPTTEPPRQRMGVLLAFFGGATNRERERKLGDDFTSPIAWVFSDPQHTLFARAPSLVSVNQYPPHSTTLIEDSYPHQAFPSHSKRCSYF